MPAWRQNTRPHWYLMLQASSSVAPHWGVEIAQWLEHWACDQKAAGSSPGRRIFFSRVNFLCWLLICCLFHPCVTAVACKRSQLSINSAGGRLQLNTQASYICDFAQSDMVHGCMVYAECAETAAVSRGTSHVSALSPSFWWILKNAL